MSSFLLIAKDIGCDEVVDVVDDVDVDVDDDDDLLFFREPPPTGTFLSEPPSVQYLLQVLQKYLGCVRL